MLHIYIFFCINRNKQLRRPSPGKRSPAACIFPADPVAGLPPETCGRQTYASLPPPMAATFIPARSSYYMPPGTSLPTFFFYLLRVTGVRSYGRSRVGGRGVVHTNWSERNWRNNPRGIRNASTFTR